MHSIVPVVTIRSDKTLTSTGTGAESHGVYHRGFAQPFVVTVLDASPAIRVALVEDDPAFARDFVAAVQSAADLQLHGVARDCRHAYKLLSGPSADVLLVDLGLPDGSGIDVIRATPQAWPRCNVMVSTVFGDEAHVIRSLEAGAIGYLLKDSAPAHIVEEIRSANAGGSPISPLIARRLLTRFRKTVNGQPNARPSPFDGERPRLSPREHEVLDYITKGFSYDEIGDLMRISRNTVLTFVRRIYAKLDVRSQREAINEARIQGLLEP